MYRKLSMLFQRERNSYVVPDKRGAKAAALLFTCSLLLCLWPNVLPLTFKSKRKKMKSLGEKK